MTDTEVTHPNLCPALARAVRQSKEKGELAVTVKKSRG